MDSVKFNNLIRKIESNSFTQKELFNLYNNATANKDISENEKEEIIEALEKTTRLKFPKAAKKIFGAKDNEAREFLDHINSKIESEYDLSTNKLKNGVKTGGGMIKGTHFIEVYLQYKNMHNIGAKLVLSQKSVDSEMRAIVEHYKTGGNDSGPIESFSFGMEEEEEIYNQFRDYIKKVV